MSIHPSELHDFEQEVEKLGLDFSDFAFAEGGLFIRITYNKRMKQFPRPTWVMNALDEIKINGWK